ncbi:MAG: SDR family NAD(P)-dependent oxidoreductase [Candidatus Aminicenantes bacterium]|nr:MAG: SDR family NAD(P)-dependent oxidoreductase [Candidatus Aminicenantes bacterium]
MKSEIRKILEEVQENKITKIEALERIKQLKQEEKGKKNGRNRIYLTKKFTYNEPYLRAHILFGQQVLLGVTHCSMAIEAARSFCPGVDHGNRESLIHIHKFVFHQPVVVYPGEAVEVGIEVEKRESDDDRVFFRNIFKKSPGVDFTVSTTGEYVFGSEYQPCSIDIPGFRDHSDKFISSREIFQKELWQRPGVLQTVGDVYIRGSEVLGEMVLKPGVKDITDPYVVHPVLLDGGFIVSVSDLSDELLHPGDGQGMWIPFMIKDIFVRGPVSGYDGCVCLGKVVNVNSNALTVDYTIGDETGQVWLAVKEFTFKYAGEGAFLNKEDNRTNESKVMTGAKSEEVRIPAPGELHRSSSAGVLADGLAEGIHTYLVNKIAVLLGYSGGLLTGKRDKNFMDLGIDSNTLIRLSEEIEREVGIELYPTLFFEYQNIEELTSYFINEHKDVFSRYLDIGESSTFDDDRSMPGTMKIDKSFCGGSGGIIGRPCQGLFSKRAPLVAEGSKDIAIIGMAGRFAGSPTLDAFWENLREGRDLITEVPADHFDWRPWFEKNRDAPNKTYCKWGSFIEVDKFDPVFFGISPREAVWMDPQFRILLEVVHEAIEEAGYGQRIWGSQTGVFVGVCYRDYWDEIVRAHTPLVDYQASGCFLCSFPGRLSYTFDLQGQSMPIDNACASSLTAVHLACKALRDNECEMAFAAGTNLVLSPLHYVSFSRVQALSPTGRCYTFDKAADGYVPGEGVAALLLKPLSKAIRDGDQIHAIIKGSAANHVGKSNNPMSPRPELQTAVVLKAWKEAGIDPGTISYIEAHGTGTILGDPVEINALKKAFSHFTRRQGFCGIGSAKAHIGHLEGAAGIAGVVKTVLAMKHKQVPAMPFFKEINPYIQLEDSPFYINTALQPWETAEGVPRRAGISSFGMAGNNTHVVLEEYMPSQEITASTVILNESTPGIFVLSGRSEERLKVYTGEMSDLLESAGISWASLVYTLQVGREAMEERLAVVAAGIEELKEKLGRYCRGEKDIPGLYRGNTAGSTARTELLMEGEEGREFVLRLIEKQKLDKLARLWVSGMEIDWQLLYPVQTPPRVSLPTYPFKKEQCWKPEIPRVDGTAVICGHVSKLHPFIDANESTLEEQCFMKVFTREDYCLRDHVVGGKMVLPGVAYLEMARAAGNLARKNMKVKKIKNIVWARPVILDTDKDAPRVYMGLYTDAHTDTNMNRDEEMVRYEVYTVKEEGKRLVHVWGQLVYADQGEKQAGDERLDIEAARARCIQKGDGAKYYELAEKAGLHYGVSFRLMGEMYGSEEGSEALCLLELPQVCSPGFREFGLHPSIMEGALQAVMGLNGSPRDQVEPGEVYLPYSLGEVEILKPLTQRCAAYAVPAGDNTGGQVKTFNIQLADEEGQVLVKIKNFSMKVFKPQSYSEAGSAAEPDDVMAFHDEWEEASLEPGKTGTNNQEPDHVLVFFTGAADDIKIGKALEEQAAVVGVKPGTGYQPPDQDNGIYEINPGKPGDYGQLLATLEKQGFIPTRIIHMWPREKFTGEEASLGMQLERGIYSVFYLSQALMKQGVTGKVRLLYVYSAQDSPQPQHAALNGFARTLRLENSKFHYKTVEIQRQDRLTPGELLGEFAAWKDDEIEVRYLDKGRFVRRQKKFKLESGNDRGNRTARLPRESGVYLITGGTGGLGMIFARYLARQVKARLVLTDISELNGEMQKKLEELEQPGAEVLYIKADISRQSEVEDLVSRAKSRFGQINGIIHSAGILRDAFIMNKNREQMEAVLGPKVYGAVWLDKATKQEPLDFFVMFSSAAAVMGNPGQSDYAYANSFMDNFAELRTRQQHPGKTLSINWWLWKEGGMTTEKQTRATGRKTTAITPLDTQTGLDTFVKGLAYPGTRFMVMQGNAAEIRRLVQREGEKKSSREKVKTPGRGEVPGHDLVEYIHEDLVNGVSRVLNIHKKDIDIDVEMSEFGFDSVTFTEYSSLLNQWYNLEIMPAVLFEHRSLSSLARYLLEAYRDNLVDYYKDRLRLSTGSTGEETAGEVEGEDHPGEAPASEVTPMRRSRFPRQQLESKNRGESAVDSQNVMETGPIAIIGISGVMPQSDDLEVFWRHLETGSDLIVEIPPDRWDWREWYGDPALESNKTNARWGGFISRVDAFDAQFFGISPREAELMDPQQRIFMETVWKTIEDAGYRASDLAGTRTGLFVGVAGSDYSELLRDHQVEILPQMATGLSHSALANRVSYFFDFHGPSEPVDTACSSSLLALHRGMQSIRSGDCDLAIAGGVNVITSPIGYIAFSKSGMLCPDGRCKTFDKQANGYVRGEGCGAVFLKPLRKAQADADHIYAVIKGTAVNHGGHTTSLTAPNPVAQADLLVTAWKKSGIDPTTVTYIEAHGTGTSLGDPIEINGLKRAFEQLYGEWEKPVPPKAYCGIGSVKTNIGHLETAAGIAGIIKVVLAMKHKTLPATVHFKEINPQIELDGTPFYIIRETRPWECLTDEHNKKIPRRAGVSSFGFGGVNAHVVLEEWPEAQSAERRAQGAGRKEPHLIVLSAKNEERLKAYAGKMRNFPGQASASIEDIAYTLQVGRDAMAARLAIMASSLDELQEKLTQYCQYQPGMPDIENVYTGNIKEQPGNALVEGEEGEAYVKSLLEKRKPGKLGQLWVSGVNIDWRLLYPDETRTPRRISLPTYPFERKSHWIPGISISTPDQEDRKDFLYIPRWEPAPLLPSHIKRPEVKKDGKKEHKKQTVLIIYPLPSTGFEKAIAEYHRGDRVMEIGLGARTRETGTGHWEVDADDPSALGQVIGQLQFKILHDIYFLGGIEIKETAADNPDYLEESQQRGVFSLFRLIKSLSKYELSRYPIRFKVVTNDVHRVFPQEEVKPYSASLHGLTRTAAKEYPHFEMSCIDISLKGIRAQPGKEELQALVKPITADPGPGRGGNLEVAIRAGRRYVRTLKPALLPSPPGNHYHPFKRQGVYLILGGAGTIGLELSLYLAKTVQARLILLGRGELNENRKRKIDRIESLGGKVFYTRADAVDIESMRKAIDKARSIFNRIDGVIHSAGVVKNKTLENMDEEMFYRALAPKVKGSVVLYQVLKGQALDFMVFFSSSQSFIGEAGMSNYVTGNCFEDAFAYYLDRRENWPVRTINWGYWEVPGAAADENTGRYIIGQGFKPISPGEGAAVLPGILRSGVTQFLAIKAEPGLLEKMGVDMNSPAGHVVIYPEDMPSILETALDRNKQPLAKVIDFPRLERSHLEMEHFGRNLLLDAFRRMGVFLRAGERYDREDLKKKLKITPLYFRLYEILLEILGREGFIRFNDREVLTLQKLEDPGVQNELRCLEPRKNRLIADFPVIKAFLNLLWVCLEKYPDLLRGDIPAAEVMFPNYSMELMEEIYRGNDVADYHNQLVAWSVVSYIRARLPVPKGDEKIKILEIGAGTGGTSVPVFDAIRTHGYENQLIYTYTDISFGFTKYGREQYGAENPFVEFKVLDIEKEVTRQGFEPGGYDIVIAANVLHATRFIRNTLDNAKVLLKTNGWLIIYEKTSVQDFASITFGLLEGWWLYQDEQNRLPGSPLMSRGMWEIILKEQGFHRVVMLGYPLEPGKSIGQHVIAAESNGQVSQGMHPRPVDKNTDTREAVKQQESISSQTPPHREKKGGPGPREYIEKKILKTLSIVLQLTREELDIDTPYSDFGVDSILAIEIANKLNEELQVQLRSTELFNYSTVRKLTNYIIEKFGDFTGAAIDHKPEGEQNKHSNQVFKETAAPMEPGDSDVAEYPQLGVEKGEGSQGIAVIGMSGRFPDAVNVDEWWQNLAAGKNSVKEAQRWDTDTFYDPDPQVLDKSYCKWGGFLSGIDEFDPLFFNISPKEAEMMDPQQRLFLEEAWKALEDAGYADKELDGKKCGVFVGFNGADYQRLIRENRLSPDAYQMTGNYEAILSARISYFLNLRGPSITINTACSSSLVAVHLACESIRCGTSDMAVAGGVTITTSPEFYIMLSRTGVLSYRGQCRVFDNLADGIVPGEGAAAVVLKDLESARQNGDHIYGVIIGSGINQDGKTNGITAPSAPSQAELELEVYKRYKINPETIGYVEAHGTGTCLGDPIEIDALTEAFRKYTSKKQYCAVGSVKSNIGHSLAAAGVTGLIKVLLCLEYKKIVPSLNFEQENELINFQDSPFYVNTQLKEWQPGDNIPRTAAVSSFGFSGTNAHVVLQEAPLSVEQSSKTPPYYLIPISAKTQTALEQKLKDMITWLEKKGNGCQLRDISYTLLVGRSHYSFCSVFIVRDINELKRKIRAILEGEEVDDYLTHTLNEAREVSKPVTQRESALQQMGEAAIKELHQHRLTGSEYKKKLLVLADLYTKGYDMDWQGLYREEECLRISLPTYPFARERYWIPIPGPSGQEKKFLEDEEIKELMQKLETGEATVADANRMLEGRT